MGCPKCQAENKPSASYCLQCGYRLADSGSASSSGGGGSDAEKPVRGRSDGRKKTMVMTPRDTPAGEAGSSGTGKKATEVLSPNKRAPVKTPVEKGSDTRRPAPKTAYFAPGENPLSGGSKSSKPLARRKLRGWIASFDFASNGESWELIEGRNTLGRDPNECTILLDQDPGVSRRHSVIMVRKDTVYVKDLESEDGTWIGDQQLGMEGHLLRDGDSVRIGKYNLTIKLL